ncbi:MAG: prephenate dehydratase [Candidatus Coproplasma sp.]
MKKLGYLGPKGTYSHLAAQCLGADCNQIAYPSFPSLTAALTCGELDSIVLPVENTLNGAVVQNLDLLQSTDNIWACSSAKIRVDHRLITLKGAPLSGIKKIYSHEQALAQCSNYLFKNFPKAQLIATPSTAESVKNIISADVAAIAGSQCTGEGLELSKDAISDEPNNFTSFLLVVRGTPSATVKSSKIFFSVTCLHEAGALVSLLSVLANAGINLTKIESRPIKDKDGEFRFFIEIDGDYSSENMQYTFVKLREKSTSLKILGCY